MRPFYLLVVCTTREDPRLVREEHRARLPTRVRMKSMSLCVPLRKSEQAEWSNELIVEREAVEVRTSA